MVSIGIHVLGSFNGCSPELLKEVGTVRSFLHQVIAGNNLNMVTEAFHQFTPHGVTGAVVLRESHICIHTWPEKGLITLDVFTCGAEGNAEAAFDSLRALFQPATVVKKIIQR